MNPRRSRPLILLLAAAILFGLACQPVADRAVPAVAPAAGAPTRTGAIVVRPPDERRASEKEPRPGVLLAWNNVFPDRAETARWYAETAGFTGAYLGSPEAWVADAPDLSFGLRSTPGHTGLPADVVASGGRFFHKGDASATNPYHPVALAAVLAGVDGILGGVPAAARDRLTAVLFDSEQIVAPPTTRVDTPEQDAALALVTQAARDAGVLGADESFPEFYYGTAKFTDDMFTQDDEIRSDHPAYRVASWWFDQGGGPGVLWKAAKERIRGYLPGARVTTDPIVGADSRPTLPVFAARASGLDFVQNWFYITGGADRLPIYSAYLLAVAKASGLPVVQGPQLFWNTGDTSPYAGDLIATSDLLTLAFNPRNGNADPATPWGIVHWGFRPLTEGVTEEMLRPYHGDASAELIARQDENQAEILPALRGVRDFMDANRDLLSHCEDVPARVGIILTRSAHYLSYNWEWWTYFNRLTEYPFALMMAHVPFEFISEDEDFSRFDLLILPHGSFPSDRLVARLQDYPGAVTGTYVLGGVKAKIPGWINPPPIREVGAWPWGYQDGYPYGGTWREMTADQILLWLRDRAPKYRAFFEGILGPQEIDADPDLIVHEVAWQGRKVLLAVNHRMAVVDDPMAAERTLPLDTDLRVRGRWKGGVYDSDADVTTFALHYDGAGIRVLVLDSDVPTRDLVDPENHFLRLADARG